MTSPDSTPGTSTAVLPLITPVNTDAQNQNARPAGPRTGTTPIDAQIRDGLNGARDTSSRANGAESAKGTGPASTGGQTNGGGSLRRAVVELAASVDCLCGDSGGTDVAGAKHHLDLARAVLESVRESVPRGAPENRTPVAFPAVRAGGVVGTTTPDQQRPTH